MKRFLRYWVPPLLLMALIFPVGNKVLASPSVYEIFMSAFRWVFPHASYHSGGLGYIIFRKSGHFVTYGLMAFFFYRAFRAGRRPGWRPAWLIRAASAAAGYGALDEVLQARLPHRRGSPVDWAVDCAGIALALVLTARRARNIDRGAVPPPGPRSIVRALFLKRTYCHISFSICARS